MDLINLLLQTDKDLNMPNKEIEIKRLSNILGEKFIVEARAIQFDKYSEIQDKCMTVNGENTKFDVQEFNILLTLNGTYVNNERLFYNKDLKKRYNALTPKELCKKLFLSGEISKVADEITDLSGFGKNAVEEVKN